MDLPSKDPATTELYLSGLSWLSSKAWKSGDVKHPYAAFKSEVSSQALYPTPKWF